MNGYTLNIIDDSQSTWLHMIMLGINQRYTSKDFHMFDSVFVLHLVSNTNYILTIQAFNIHGYSETAGIKVKTGKNIFFSRF